MSKLVFKIGEETRPTILTHKEFDASPFADQLNDGQRRLVELLDGWRNRNSNLKNDETASVLDFSEQPVDNNIIAFLGERGSGKTSCLYSMKEIFFKNEVAKDFSEETEFLHVIDPSFFDQHHNILEIFLGELYHEYEKMVEPWERMSNAERQEIRNLHGWFAKVRQSVKFLSAQRLELPEEEEGLSALSEGVNLRLLVSELVKSYLECRGKRYLVVSIDDIDLNIREAYRMMEQIRKYLVVPNVVVLMAAKLEQLKNSIVLNLADYYRNILNSVIDMQRIQAMADRYLDKFIPLERRISMPMLTDYSSAELEIIDKGEYVASLDNTFESVGFAVLSLIYKKCGYLFYNYEEATSLIIPETLRELRSFVTMLFEMKDRDIPAIHKKNKDAFKRFFKDQCMQHMSAEQRQIAETILKEKSLAKLNKTVVALLYGYAKSLGLHSFSKSGSGSDLTPLRQIRLNEIVNPANYSENISLGDVMAVVDDLNNVAASSRIDYLIFFVTSFYSMKLYEMYDLLTDTVDKAALKQAIRESKFPALKNSKDERIPEYLQIVGHSFFTLTGESFLPASSNRAHSRELSQMNGVLLFDIIEELINEYEHDNDIVKDSKFILRLNLVEFFMLCASRKIESEDGYFSPFVENKWRAESSEFYFHAFDANSKNILFDVTAPFVNIGFMPLAFQRFSRKITDIAEVCLNSLYTRLYKDKRSHVQNPVHDLFSRVSIRNTEVLKDLNLWMINMKEIFNDYGEKDILILKKFFENVNEYSVRTYELNTGCDDYHTISFLPFGVLAKFLNTLTKESTDSDFEKVRKEQETLFMRIYRQENVVAINTIYSLQELIRILRDSKESDIPAKDAVISRIMKKTKRIMSDLLVDYLAEVDVAEKVLFSYFLDDALFAKYKNRVADNLNQQDNRLRESQISSMQKYSALKADLEGLEREHEKIQSKINPVAKRIKDEEQSTMVLDKDLRTQTLKTKELNEKIKIIEKRLKEISEQMDELKLKIEEYEKKSNELKREIKRKQSEFFAETKPYIKSKLKSELEGARAELTDIEAARKEDVDNLDALTKESNHLSIQIQELHKSESIEMTQLVILRQNLDEKSIQLERDRRYMDGMVVDASSLKHRKADVKSSLDIMENRTAGQKKEYEAFMRRKKAVMTTLYSFNR